jgi:hypothetical protein
MLWYTREASVAVYVANLPGIWPLLREHIRFLREHTNSYATGESQMPRYGSQQYGNLSTGKSKHRSRIHTARNLDAEDTAELVEIGKKGAMAVHANEIPMTMDENPFEARQASRGSDGDVEGKELDLEDGGAWKCLGGVGVQIDTKVEIQSDEWTDCQLEAGQSRVVTCEGPDAQAGRR